jgi:hypothetical protein
MSCMPLPGITQSGVYVRYRTEKVARIVFISHSHLIERYDDSAAISTKVTLYLLEP